MSCPTTAPSHPVVPEGCRSTPLAHTSPHTLMWPLLRSYQVARGLTFDWSEEQSQVHARIPATGCAADRGPASAAGAIALAGNSAAFSSARA